MISAKDFFYANYTRSNNGARYAENYKNISDYEKKELEHSVRWSNDKLIDSYMHDLVSVAPPELRSRVQQCFVGKLRDFKANAVALPVECDHYGDLIFFNVGLSDACFQYAILYVEIIKLFNTKKPASDTEHMISAVAMSMAKLASAQDRWNTIGEVALTPDDNLLPREGDTAMAVSIAVMADKFVLYHEICHHLLGHTSKQSSNFVEALPDECKIWLQPISNEHKREFQADAGAVLLALWAAKRDSRSAEITAALGAMLFFTTIGQSVPDAWKESASHPAEGERFKQCCNILAHLLPEDSDFGDILRDIIRFQVLLYQTQDQGIGSKFLKTAVTTNSEH